MEDSQYICPHDKKIVYFSRFPNNPSGNGGDKRTSQICEILERIGYDFVSMAGMSPRHNELVKNIFRRPSNYVIKKIARFYYEYVTYRKYAQWSDEFRGSIVYLHMMSRAFVNSLNHRKPDLFIIDDPVFLAPVFHYARSNNIPIVAFCHNLETLSSAQVTSKFQRDMLMYELDLIGQCDLVVTISTEETFLLKNLGMDPLYLPYFPLKQTLERFTKVRRSRLGKLKADFLLLGTVHNLPTLQGMKQIISLLSNNYLLNDDRLIVVGYGTKERLTHEHDTRIQIRGDVSDAELDELLTSVKGCIVYQESGSGSLTKIPELLLAGVPVVVNSHAARSHHNLPGIFEFGTFDQLPGQLVAAAGSDQFLSKLSSPDTSRLEKRIVDLLK